MGRRTWSLFLALAALCGLAVAAITAMYGVPQSLAAGQFHARLHVAPFARPAAFDIDVETLATDLGDNIREMSERSSALRYMLDDAERQQLNTSILPRLLNRGIMAGMLEDMDNLAPAIEAAGYRAQVTGAVVNATGAELGDVVLSLPQAVRAELPDGTALPLVQTEGGDTILRLGTLAPGGETRFAAWLSAEPQAVFEGESRVRLASTEGNGHVTLLGREGWSGATLEASGWARWLIVGALALVAALSALFAVMALATGRLRRG